MANPTAEQYYEPFTISFEDLCTALPTEDLLPHFIQEKVVD